MVTNPTVFYVASSRMIKLQLLTFRSRGRRRSRCGGADGPRPAVWDLLLEHVHVAVRSRVISTGDLHTVQVGSVSLAPHFELVAAEGSQLGVVGFDQRFEAHRLSYK